MSHGVELLPGERLLWAGLRGQPLRVASGALGLRMAYGWMMLCFFGAIGGAPLLVLPETRLYALGFVALVVAGVLAYRRHRRRPAIFITDRRLVDRSLFGTKSVELLEIGTYARQVTHVHYRGSVSDVASNLLVVQERSGRVSLIGPVLAYDEISAFLDGVIAREIDPATMRSLDGEPAAAERREDIFVAVENQSDGEAYGPLFIGPRGLVRFTSKLPIALEGLLLTALAGGGPLEDLESRVVLLARRPDAGHAQLVDLSTAELRLEGNALRVVSPGQGTGTLRVELHGADAARARRYLEKQRPSAYR